MWLGISRTTGRPPACGRPITRGFLLLCVCRKQRRVKLVMNQHARSIEPPRVPEFNKDPLVQRNRGWAAGGRAGLGRCTTEICSVVDEPGSTIRHTLVLRRVDPETNVARFYALMIEHDLF